MSASVCSIEWTTSFAHSLVVNATVSPNIPFDKCIFRRIFLHAIDVKMQRKWNFVVTIFSCVVALDSFTSQNRNVSRQVTFPCILYRRQLRTELCCRMRIALYYNQPTADELVVINHMERGRTTKWMKPNSKMSSVRKTDGEERDFARCKPKKKRAKKSLSNNNNNCNAAALRVHNDRLCRHDCSRRIDIHSRAWVRALAHGEKRTDRETYYWVFGVHARLFLRFFALAYGFLWEKTLA